MEQFIQFIRSCTLCCGVVTVACGVHESNLWMVVVGLVCLAIYEMWLVE